MGCDIHVYVERKINDEWHMIHAVDREAKADKRDYAFFASLCGVRGEGPEPKGLPPDVSPATQYHADTWADGHSHSWETYTEFIDKKLVLMKLRGESEKSGHSRGYYEYIILGCELASSETADLFRVVFWFDN